ncbi:hypothetical protein KXD40_007973 [Peronospora effusa]|uniref:Uncharacterized protein n=1 Tax=Peronospora effusa TaxID=542832 RepID=A0A3M6VS21_9STRA|nr:hypothetical protein DD238_004152 [Peronospora effusa]RQM13731.1 hypothetical protein DD237_006343 [Peronospora effusa]UIZ23307.1 hypothetical protein KXD40_007973 [Peronospora effusa]CAI5701365.1 unnamed protein product [Peronospora effusa]
MGTSDDEGVAFRSNALDIVSSWLLGGDGNEDKIKQEMQQKERRPVTLYRPSSSSAPSLTRPNAAHVDVTLTETEREMKRKLLRKSRGSHLEEAALAEKEVQTQWDEAQDEEEQELVRLKTQTPKDDRKRKRTVQDELLDKLREDAAKKKAKNLKRKLQLQRKKQQQQRQLNQNDVTAAN